MISSFAVKPRAIALAPLPPPVTGLTVATERFIAATSNAIDWQVKSVGRPSQTRSGGQLSRLARSVRAGCECLFASRSKITGCYMPLSAGITMIYNIGFAIACSSRRIPILVHHHSYSYLNAPSRSMAWLNRILTERDGHIFLSDTMQAAYDQRYTRRAQAVILPNSYATSALSDASRNDVLNNKPLRIGHFSNLSIEKGLKTVLDTFAELRQQKMDCELQLAGPLTGANERELVELARLQFGTSLKIRGPLYGADKDAYFRELDFFWFPSEYVNEAQPIVLVEALAYGIPCVAMRRGCIEWLLGDAGTIASDRQQFMNIAIEQAKNVSESLFCAARRRCRKRYEELRAIESTGLADAIRFLGAQQK